MIELAQRHMVATSAALFNFDTSSCRHCYHWDYAVA